MFLTKNQISNYFSFIVAKQKVKQLVISQDNIRELGILAKQIFPDYDNLSYEQKTNIINMIVEDMFVKNELN